MPCSVLKQSVGHVRYYGHIRTHTHMCTHTHTQLRKPGTDSPVHSVMGRGSGCVSLVPMPSVSSSTSSLARRESNPSFSVGGGASGPAPPGLPRVNVSYEDQPLDRQGIISITADVQNFLAAILRLRKAIEEADNEGEEGRGRKGGGGGVGREGGRKGGTEREGEGRKGGVREGERWFVWVCENALERESVVVGGGGELKCCQRSHNVDAQDSSITFWQSSLCGPKRL